MTIIYNDTAIRQSLSNNYLYATVRRPFTKKKIHLAPH